MGSFCAPLHSRSSYSLLRGTASPERLAAAVRAAGYDTLALTDRNNLYAAVRFAGAARAAGLAPILGVELDEPAAAAADGAAPVAVLLARGAAGYRTLARLVTRRHLDPAFALVPALAAEHEDVHVLAVDPVLLAMLKPVLPPDRLWLLIAATAADRGAFQRGRALGRKLGVAPLAAPPVFYAAAPERATARLLAAARSGRLAPAVPDRELADPAACPTPPHALARRFGAEAADLLARSAELAADCRAELPGGAPIFPRPAGAPDEVYPMLLERCLAGLRHRYGALARPPVARLMRELEVIAALGFADYFLIVGDIVAHARSEGCPVVGRGSGASSIVAYALGITNVDPLAHRLHFERFLSAARGGDLPDLDVDLDWRGRDRVIAHVYRTYGEDRVAMISTHACFHPRSAFREAARAHGIGVAAVNRLARLLPHTAAAADLAALVRARPGLREQPWAEPPWRDILAGTAELCGLPRHLGIHPGGVVIGDRPLADLVPLERAAKGIVVTQFEMDAIAAIGLVKIDLLGNRALATLGEAARLAARGAPPLDLDRAADHDEPTARLLAAGDTLGCFQIESPGMRQLLTMLAPRSVRDIVDALSLIRPGPASSGMKERFVRRARGLEPAAAVHPALAPVLAATHGIPLYEEDVMSIAAAVAGLDLAAADSLRRAIAGAANPEEMRLVRNGFVARAVHAGIDPDDAVRVWEEMARFAAYSFSRAHASGYGLLAYQSAYLKVHEPAAFACAVLNHHQGMYPRWLHVEDARRHGVRVLLPSLARSALEFTLETDADGVAQVRTGLGAIGGLSAATAAALLAARAADGPFASLADLRRRVRPAAPEVEALIRAGALDELGMARSRLLWAARAEQVPATEPPGPALFSGAVGEAPPPALRELAPGRQLASEWAALGFSPRAHPLFVAAPELAAALAPAAARALELVSAGGEPRARATGALATGAHWIGAGELAAHHAERVVVAGLAAAHRSAPTKNGETMAFLTLDDPTGTAECTLFPAVFRRAARELAGGGALSATGRVTAQHGAASLEVERLTPLVASPVAPAARAGARPISRSPAAGSGS